VSKWIWLDPLLIAKETITGEVARLFDNTNSTQELATISTGFGLTAEAGHTGVLAPRRRLWASDFLDYCCLRWRYWSYLRCCSPLHSCPQRQFSLRQCRDRIRCWVTTILGLYWWCRQPGRFSSLDSLCGWAAAARVVVAPLLPFSTYLYGPVSNPYLAWRGE
jgi:hypothetical protein